MNNNYIYASVNMFGSVGAIGDSYTAASVENSEGKWIDLIDQSWIGTLCNRAGVPFSKYGQGGATTKSYLAGRMTDVLNSMPNDAYFFALGINDSNNDFELGTIDDIHDDDFTKNPDTFYGCYGKIIAQVKNHAPKAKLIMVKIMTNGPKKLNYDSAIEDIARHYGIPFNSPSDDDFFSSEAYNDYKVSGHPTAMGYSMIGLAMERLFSKCVTDNLDYFKFSTVG